VVAESGTSGLDVGRKLGFIKRSFGRSHIFFGDDVVDRLFHLLIFFIYNFGESSFLSSQIPQSYVYLIKQSSIRFDDSQKLENLRQ